MNYPVLKDRHHPDQPKTVPFMILQDHEDFIKGIHGQSLEKLRKRGGLNVYEIAAAIQERDPYNNPPLTWEQCWGIINEAIAEISNMDEISKITFAAPFPMPVGWRWLFENKSNCPAPWQTIESDSAPKDDIPESNQLFLYSENLLDQINEAKEENT